MDNVSLINEVNQLLSRKYSDFKGCYVYGEGLARDVNQVRYIDIVALFENLDYDKDICILESLSRLEYKYDIFIDIQTFTPWQLSLNPIFYEIIILKGQFYGC
jgi:hypothetical protein